MEPTTTTTHQKKMKFYEEDDSSVGIDWTRLLPKDLWLEFFSFLSQQPLAVRSCKLVCKLWKSWMELSFNHSFKKYLPLVSNCERGNVSEVERLLKTIPNHFSKGQGYIECCRSPWNTSSPEIIKLLLTCKTINPCENDHKGN